MRTCYRLIYVLHALVRVVLGLAKAFFPPRIGLRLPSGPDGPAVPGVNVGFDLLGDVAFDEESTICRTTEPRLFACFSSTSILQQTTRAVCPSARCAILIRFCVIGIFAISLPQLFAILSSRRFITHGKKLDESCMVTRCGDMAWRDGLTRWPRTRLGYVCRRAITIQLAEPACGMFA